MFLKRRKIQAMGALAFVIALSSMLSVHSARSAPSRESAVSTSPGKNGLIAFKRLTNQSTGALFAVGPSGSGQRQITRPEAGVVDDQPDWSPNGSMLVFHRIVPDRPFAIYTIKADGSDLTRLSPPCTTPSGPGIETSCEDGEGASFLPDGKRVVYTRATGNVKSFGVMGDHIEHSDIVVRNLSGGEPQVLLRSKPYQGDFLSPSFSPGGSQFVYVRSNSPETKPAGGRALFVATADGSRQRQITPWALDAGDGPDWSPSGKLIVFRSYVEGGQQSQIYVVRPDGTGLRRLTRFKAGTTVLSYSFSPDGKWITFAKSGKGGEPDIFVMTVNGTDIRQITRTAVWDSAPDWGSAR